MLGVILHRSDYAQVDTTDWFPMQTGNYWEYRHWDDPPKYFSVRILGDTTMSNGNSYKIFYKKKFETGSDFTWYFRVDSNKVYRFYGDSVSCPNLEYVYYDFNTEDSIAWLVCAPVNGNARSNLWTYYDYGYFHFLNKPNLAKFFEDVDILGNDTIYPSSLSPGPITINQGLGVVWYVIYQDGSYLLQGAIINGVQFGTLTGLSESSENNPTKLSLSSFPNPFNCSVNLKINIPVSAQLELSVFNILGEKITTIVDDYRISGTYGIQFNANNLSSGVYLVVLKQQNMILTEKIVLIK